MVDAVHEMSRVSCRFWSLKMTSVWRSIFAAIGDRTLGVPIAPDGHRPSHTRRPTHRHAPRPLGPHTEASFRPSSNRDQRSDVPLPGAQALVASGRSPIQSARKRVAAHVQHTVRPRNPTSVQALHPSNVTSHCPRHCRCYGLASYLRYRTRSALAQWSSARQQHRHDPAERPHHDPAPHPTVASSTVNNNEHTLARRHRRRLIARKTENSLSALLRYGSHRAPIRQVPAC